MYRTNSTIQRKKKTCLRCGKECYIFSHGHCERCARIVAIFEEGKRETERYIDQENLQILIVQADDVFSKYIRFFYSDRQPLVQLVTCYTCDRVQTVAQIDCGHYIPRDCLQLRWSVKNGRPQCRVCNRMKDGNILEYGRRLELESPGITSKLEHDAIVIYKPTRQDVKDIIAHYKNELKALAA